MALVKKKTPVIAEIIYQPNTDRIQNVICRTPTETRENYADMLIAPCAKKTVNLLKWYLKHPDRRTADTLQMWPSQQDALDNPKDLNIFGGLPFDERYENETKNTK